MTLLLSADDADKVFGKAVNVPLDRNPIEASPTALSVVRTKLSLNHRPFYKQNTIT